MSTSPGFYRTEITRERIAEIMRRAHIERSEAIWQLLAGIFRDRTRDDELPEGLGAASRRPC